MSGFRARHPLVGAGILHASVTAAAAGALGAAWLLAAGARAEAFRFAAWALSGGALTAALVVANAGRLAAAPAGGAARVRLGLANSLTLVRFALIAPTVCLLAEDRFPQAAVVYGVLVLTDVVDGVVARTRRQTSPFGVYMDPLADVLSTLAVFTVFRVDDLIPAWLYLLLVVRYAMLCFGSLLLSRVVGPIEYRATIPGKIVGVVQAAAALWIMRAAALGPPNPRWSGLLFAFLGLGFVSIVISQAVIGWRHVRRAAARRRGWQGGSSR